MKLQSLFVVFVATASCARSSPPTPRAAEPSRIVTTVAVEASGASPVTVPATVLARERATLAARVSGSVVALPYREGESVRRGQVVARIEARALGSAVIAAEAEKAAAEADLARVDRLLSRGAATTHEADQARARAAAARAGVAAAREAFGHAELRAPFGGRVSARPANVGDVVMPGTTILEIEGTSGLEIVATIEAVQAARLRVGARATVDVDGQPAPLDAVVRAVSEAGDPVTHRVQVRADLPPVTGLRSGVFARLALPVRADATHLAVPASAIVSRGSLTGVYVVREGRARLRWIAAGEARAGAVEVRAGLDPGERVVRDPAGLADGTAVREG